MRKTEFGRLEDGRQVEEIWLESADAAVSILSLGCINRDWRVDGPDGGSLPMVLGFDDLGSYLHFSRSHGAVVGRVANRTANARFEMEGRVHELTPNDGPRLQHHLHGGPEGLGTRLWEMEGDSASDTVRLRYHSPDGEAGYPGAVDFEVTYRLEGPRLVCEMTGRPDRPTPINLAHHNYYNLGGQGTVKDHAIRVDAEEYLPLDAEQIPTGQIAPVEGTGLDFREARPIQGEGMQAVEIDNNFILRPGRDTADPAAEALCPRTGLRLRLWTAEPGLQVFDTAGMEIAAPGLEGRRYGRFAGLCFEPQHFPDSLHHPEWPSILRSPDMPYFQRLEVEIGRG